MGLNWPNSGFWDETEALTLPYIPRTSLQQAFSMHGTIFASFLPSVQTCSRSFSLLFQLTTTLPRSLLKFCNWPYPRLRLHEPLYQLSRSLFRPPLSVPPITNQCAFPSHFLQDLVSFPRFAYQSGLFPSADKCLLQKTNKILSSYRRYKPFSWPHLPFQPPPYCSALSTNISKPHLHTLSPLSQFLLLLLFPICLPACRSITGALWNTNGDLHGHSSIFLDLSAAFDTADHSFLLTTLPCVHTMMSYSCFAGPSSSTLPLDMAALRDWAQPLHTLARSPHSFPWHWCHPNGTHADTDISNLHFFRRSCTQPDHLTPFLGALVEISNVRGPNLPWPSPKPKCSGWKCLGGSQSLSPTPHHPALLVLSPKYTLYSPILSISSTSTPSNTVPHPVCGHHPSAGLPVSTLAPNNPFPKHNQWHLLNPNSLPYRTSPYYCSFTH